MGNARKAKWAYVALGVFVFLAFTGLGVSTWMFSRWTGIRTTTGDEARTLLDAAATSTGSEAPYMDLAASGQVTVRRELESNGPDPLSTLHILAFDPGHSQLYSMDLPWWFVRVKMNDTINLGTLASTLARDWENLDLKVTEEDLERLGPGLVLDQGSTEKGRLVVWTE